VRSPSMAERPAPARPAPPPPPPMMRHLPEYLMEAALLGLFMISACTFTVLLQHPASPVRGAIPDPFARRLNPAITLTFTRLGKVAPRDALFYMVAQFAGGLAGVLIARTALGGRLAHCRSRSGA